jgi:hypothetical protein
VDSLAKSERAVAELVAEGLTKSENASPSSDALLNVPTVLSGR